MTNRKSHTRFRLVPKSTTLDDLEGPLRTVFQNTCVFRSPTRTFVCRWTKKCCFESVTDVECRTGCNKTQRIMCVKSSTTGEGMQGFFSVQLCTDCAVVKRSVQL